MNFLFNIVNNILFYFHIDPPWAFKLPLSNRCCGSFFQLYLAILLTHLLNKNYNNPTIQFIFIYSCYFYQIFFYCTFHFQTILKCHEALMLKKWKVHLSSKLRGIASNPCLIFQSHCKHTFLLGNLLQSELNMTYPIGYLLTKIIGIP